MDHMRWIPNIWHTYQKLLTHQWNLLDLDECKIKLGVKLVPLNLMQKMYKLQTTARYQRIDHFLPGVLDHHIEEIIQSTFQKIGKPMPKISAKAILQKLLQHVKQRRRETILKKCKQKIHLEID